MRRLWLLRHGHAAAGSPDAERALDGRGRHQAAAVGAGLRRAEARPDRIVSSPARRARETAEIVRDALDGDVPLTLEPSLYLASPAALLEVVGLQDDREHTVLLVGHNPGLGDLAQALARRGEPAALRALQRGFPTAALADLTFDVDRWADITPHTPAHLLALTRT